MGKNDIECIWTDKKRTIFGLPISFTRYFLTESKLITRKGFLTVEEDELDLYKVTDKKLVLKLGQRIFKCGTIVLNVRDVDTPIKEIKAVKKPREVLAMIDKQIDINRDKYNIRGRDMIGGGMPGFSPADAMDAFDHDVHLFDDTDDQ
ncbi:MAG: PH domain-containing protein [Ruminococcus sp.]|nr:PH domain-containing protein [Ruminococcus sp.]